MRRFLGILILFLFFSVLFISSVKYIGIVNAIIALGIAIVASLLVVLACWLIA